MAKEQEKKLEHLPVIQSNLSTLIKSKASAMPQGFNETRFIQNCMCVLQDMNQEKLKKCTPISVAMTLLKGAFLGLDFFNGECYAIPYNKNIGSHDNPTWIIEMKFQTDYKGERKLVKKYSIRKAKDAFAKTVRKGDKYEIFIENSHQFINFHPLPFNNDEIIGCFAVVVYDDGDINTEEMSKEEINEVKENYAKKDQKGKFSKAWDKSFGEMCKKTVLRRLCKSIDLQFESAEQTQTFAESSEFEFNNKKKISTKPDVEQPKEIECAAQDVTAEEYVPDQPEQPKGNTAKPITERQMSAISKMLVHLKDDGTMLKDVLEKNKVHALSALTIQQGSEIIKGLSQNA